MKFRLSHLFYFAAATLLGASTASAEMGLAPSSTNGIYVSLGGGYLLTDSNGVIGYGRDPGTGITEDLILEAKNGWFADAMAGYASTAPIFAGLPFTHIELYGIFGRSSDSASDTAPPYAGLSLKNDDATLLVTGGVEGQSNTVRKVAEGGLSFKSDSSFDATRSLTFSVTPFVRWMGEDTETTISQCCILERDANVDTWMYGLLVALEPEAALTSQISIVGRLGAGLYGYRTTGDFVSFPNSPVGAQFAANVSDSESGIGFRGQLGIGVKFKITPGANLEAFTEADYFSNAGTSELSNNQPLDETPSHVGSTDVIELRSGIRLTLQLGQ